MTTAIIVSGVLRNMINASSSWKFPGDYFLHVDNNICRPHSKETIGYATDIIGDNIKNSAVDFVNVTIDFDNKMKFLKRDLPEDVQIYNHPNINMAWRWKYAFNYLKFFTEVRNYDRVLLLRPDMWIFQKGPLELYNDMIVEPNVIYSSARIGIDPVLNLPIMADTFILCDLNTFEKLSKFCNYFIDNYNDTIFDNVHDTHTLLARFISEQGITVSSRLGEIFDFVVLRDNTNHMFEQGKLKSEYGAWDLSQKQEEWWKEKYG
jgi:hypothetical protein